MSPPPPVILLLVLALAFLQMPATTPAAEDSVESLRFKLSAERQVLDKPLEELGTQYAQALERLKDEVTKSGDLAKRLLVDREIAHHGGKEGERPDPGAFVQLAKLRTIYETRKAELAAQADSQREKLLVSYKAQFDTLQKNLTVGNKIDEAVEAKQAAASLDAELERLRGQRKAAGGSPILGREPDAVELAWEAPFAGSLGKASASEVEFIGAAKHDTFGMAVVKGRLPKSYSVQGQIQVNAYYPGIVFGYDSDKKPFALAYADATGTQIETWSQGIRVQTTHVDVKWKPNAWESFELSKGEDGWSMKIGSQEAALPVPSEIRGNGFGFVSFGPGSVLARRLKVSNE